MKLNRIILALICVTLLVLSACSNDKSDTDINIITYGVGPVITINQSGRPELTPDNYPRIDGSTANIPLMTRLYSNFCGVSLEDAETSVITSGGTGAVWRNMLAGNADLLLVYEAPKSVQSEIGSKLEIAPIGRDGLVFLVNASNPVNNLTRSQLIKIYTGKIEDWKKVGGKAGKITAFQRNLESGSQTLFLNLLMKDKPPMTPPAGWILGQMNFLINSVAAPYDGSDGAIGFSVFYYASLMYANPDIKILSVDGIVPSNESIQDGSYPLVNNFYVVIRADEPENSPARLLRDWLLSAEGNELLYEAGYVPVKYE